ncbi:hypothetical protein HFP51_08860 [Parasphingopyxis sp. CP4]|uniref:sulfotransferase family protein n=1 Tax=Parasphingopyxis sp. CP4 TaxID=2724527 RepID=UPI0015A08983|nr:hypothetical protein [Parasphingopyxis sp. CP4]QLC22275.1 hypothetical protein HFP51_08860 [Parasphingopyxis sp. CP4]
MPTKDLILVIGMHRTGSSIITCGVQALGIDLGDNLMPPAENNNSKGFFEDLDLNAINEALLGEIGAKWHHLSWIDETALRTGEQFADLRTKAAILLTSKFENCQSFAFKDPRTAVFLPFWLQVCDQIAAEPHFIIGVRNPLECAQSLHNRDGFHLVRGVLLWAKHMIDAIRWTQDHHQLCVGYQQMLSSPETELQRIADWLDLSPDPGRPSAIDEYRDDFLDQRLRRHDSSAAELARSIMVPPFVAELYQQLVVLAATASDDREIEIDWQSLDCQLQRIRPLFDIAMLFERKNPPPFDFDGLLKMAKALQSSVQRDDR